MIPPNQLIFDQCIAPVLVRLRHSLLSYHEHPLPEIKAQALAGYSAPSHQQWLFGIRDDAGKPLVSPAVRLMLNYAQQHGDAPISYEMAQIPPTKIQFSDGDSVTFRCVLAAIEYQQPVTLYDATEQTLEILKWLNELFKIQMDQDEQRRSR